jgi:hypothetical protein
MISVVNRGLPFAGGSAGKVAGDSDMQQTTEQINQFPPGWNHQRVEQVLMHYEAQTEEEAVAEDEASLLETATDQPVLTTLWAVVRGGKIELLANVRLPEGATLLATLLPETIPNG